MWNITDEPSLSKQNTSLARSAGALNHSDKDGAQYSARGAKSSEDILADSTRSNHDKESFSSSSSTNLLPGNNRRRTGLAYCMSHLYLYYIII